MKRPNEISIDDVIELPFAVEYLLAEMGVTEPGAGQANHEGPAGVFLDRLYMAWLRHMRRQTGDPKAILEPLNTAEIGEDEAKCCFCGCTEDAACPGGCHWIPDPKQQMRDICSACKEFA